jgi:hypothetical protein
MPTTTKRKQGKVHQGSKTKYHDKKSTPHRNASAAASKGAQAMHKKHPKGHLTSAMLAADRSNMAIARSALAAQKGSLASSASVSGAVVLNQQGRLSLKAGEKAARRAQFSLDIRGKKHALGTRETAITLGWKRFGISKWKQQTGANLTGIRKITGIIRRAPKRISPSSFEQTTRWRQSKAHHLRKRLYIRKPRIKRIKKWRKRAGTLHPR